MDLNINNTVAGGATDVADRAVELAQVAMGDRESARGNAAKQRLSRFQ